MLTTLTLIGQITGLPAGNVVVAGAFGRTVTPGDTASTDTCVDVDATASGADPLHVILPEFNRLVTLPAGLFGNVLRFPVLRIHTGALCVHTVKIGQACRRLQCFFSSGVRNYKLKDER